METVAFAVVAAIVLTFLVRVACRSPAVAHFLPCPNLPCTNRLPRRGTWSHANGEWAVEECQVCGASIQYRSGIEKSAALSPTDCYIRVVAPVPARETDG